MPNYEIRNARGELFLSDRMVGEILDGPATLRTMSGEQIADLQARLEETAALVERASPSFREIMPDPAVGLVEQIRRRRLVLERNYIIDRSQISSVLLGAGDRRHPAIRAYAGRAADDSVEGCACLPCRFVNRELSFFEMLDEWYEQSYANQEVQITSDSDERGISLADPSIPTSSNGIGFDDLEGFDYGRVGLSIDPWATPRRARAVPRPEPRRLDWRPNSDERAYYFGDTYDTVTGNYVEPRYNRYDRNGNEVLPGPTTRNNRLPSHHLAMTDASSRNRDRWFSIENAAVRNDSTDMEPGEDDLDYDYEEGRYSQAELYGIQPWDYKPLDFTFYGERHTPTTPYFGFELEINSHYPNAEIINRVEELYTKWDGSISGGFEIVSMPMTWEYMTETFNFNWVPQLREAGAKAGRNGLHVHVSRSSFNNDFHAWRWLKLWSDVDNYAAVRTFNRRQSLEYATPFDRATPYAKARRLEVGNGSRYVLLNSQNYATFELRGPASTLNRFKLKGTLAVIAATVEYTRQKMTSAQVALGGLEWRAFIEWALEQETYAESIRKYLEILLEEGAPEAVYPAYLRENK